MTESDLFKYDVRIRERLIRRGLVTEREVTTHLDGLSDVEAKSETLPQHQPALGQNDARGHAAEEGDDDDDDDDEEAS